MIDIVRLISELPKKHRNSSGNCGVFANAMCRFLADQGLQCQLVTIGDSEEGEYDDSSLYHVCFATQGRAYDGSGLIANVAEFAARFAATRYGDATPHVHYADATEANRNHVRRNTDYTAYEDAIYAAVQACHREATAPAHKP